MGKQIEHDVLQFRFQVDQQVATTDEIDARKRHAAADVLLAENDDLSQDFRNSVAVIDSFEETLAVLGR